MISQEAIKKCVAYYMSRYFIYIKLYEMQIELQWYKAMETVTDFIFLGSKITADGDYSHEIKRCLLLGRKAMTYLDSTETLLCWQRSV